MRRLRMLVVIVVVAAVAASCAQTVNVEQERSALLAADAAWAQTTKDFDTFMSTFGPDASMSFHGMPILKGDKAIRDAIGPMWKAPGFGLTWTATKAEVASSGDLGYTMGNYELTMNNAAGMPVTDKGKFITTWKKIDGAWKVIDDIGNSDAPTPVSSPHVMKTTAEMAWGDPPPTLPPGAKMAVVNGDPTKAEPFTVRAQMPAGYRIAPHWHPTDEHVTVISGTFAFGMGKAFDQGAMKDLGPGGYATMSATMPHYAMAKTPAVIQVHGMGPLVLNYVNPADDPSKK